MCKWNDHVKGFIPCIAYMLKKGRVGIVDSFQDCFRREDLGFSLVVQNDRRENHASKYDFSEEKAG